MKNKLILSTLICLAALSPAPPLFSKEDGIIGAKEIIANCARAMGGISKIEQVKSLRIWAVYPDHGDRPLGQEIRRPNKSYNLQGGLVYDGKRACWLKGQDGKSKPEMIPTDWLVDFDVEIAYYFPAFFDYPADYNGSEEVEGRPTHKLRIKFPLGAVVVYFVDAETWLPCKIKSQFALDGKELGGERTLSDYREVDGILYPHGFTYPSRDRASVLNGRVTSVEFNASLDDAHFTIPSDIR